MPRTKQSLRNQALQELGILPLGQSASAEWAESMDGAYTEVYHALDRRGLVSWNIGEDIPDQYANPIVILMAAQRANVAGVSNDRYQRIVGAVAGAKSEIESLSAGFYSNPSPVTDF